jgi:hypothetical protein
MLSPPPPAEPFASATSYRRHRARWLGERFAAARYPLSPALIAADIARDGVDWNDGQLLSPEMLDVLTGAIAQLPAERIRLLQAIFVDQVGIDELAIALHRPAQELWRERRAAILSVRLAIIAAARG